MSDAGGQVWSNWAREQVCQPARFERPTDESQLCEIVARAAAEGLTVRAAGSGHSFTDCACTDGVMIDMSGMRRVLEVDLERGRVTVQGGARLYELGPVLERYGLALENQGDVDRQTITGAISTGTHGTGARFGNLSSQIVAIRLVTADGSVLELDGDGGGRDGDGGDGSGGDAHDLYLGARVSIGALGILSAVTIQCVPLYTLHRRDAPMPLSEVLADLDAHVDGNDHFEFFIFPFTELALTRSTRRSNAEPVPTAPWRRWVEEELLENHLLGALCRTGRAMPALAPRINRLIAGALSASEVEDRAYRVYATTRNVRFTEMEYAIPRAAAAEAVQRVLALPPRLGLPILFPLEVRFAAGDDAFLSAAYRQESCYIAVHQYAGMEFETYFRAVEAIMDGYGGRPHWGKRHYQSAAVLHARYPQWERFQELRDRLDPNRTFANAYTRRVLGA